MADPKCNVRLNFGDTPGRVGIQAKSRPHGLHTGQSVLDNAYAILVCGRLRIIL
jgi:hypothetical protein